MPSKSKKQHDFMEAAAHNPEFAQQAGIATGVAQEFANADKASGNFMKHSSDGTHHGDGSRTRSHKGKY